MSPPNPSSPREDGEAASPRSPNTAPSWLREWNGFSDFTLQGTAVRGPMDGITNPEYLAEHAATVREIKKAIEEHRSVSDSTIPSKKGKNPFVQSLTKWFKKGGKRISLKGREQNPFLNLPMDIMLIILEHLDPMDRVMLKFTCKSLYSTIPLDVPFPFPKHSCGKARMFMRLMDSRLLPKFYQKTDLLNKSQTKVILRNFKDLLSCELCENHWYVNSAIQCPFHYPMNTEPKHTLRDLIRDKVGLRFLMQHLIPSGSVSREEYVDFTERSVADAPVTSFRSFKFGFVKSWDKQIKSWQNSGLYETPRNVRQIWTLHCCSHCMNVLPSNSYLNKCANCDCEMCGWTPVQILRVYGTHDGQPRFVPLGHLRKETKTKTLKVSRDHKLVDHGKPKDAVLA